jgi:hypothetical protein
VKKDSGNNGGIFTVSHYCATRQEDDERHRRLRPSLDESNDNIGSVGSWKTVWFRGIQH